MVLDTFMEGFLFQLFEAKWEKFARRTLVLLVMMDVINFVLLLMVGMDVRNVAEERQPMAAYGQIAGKIIRICCTVLVAMGQWL